jgi:hypothetical protein
VLRSGVSGADQCLLRVLLCLSTVLGHGLLRLDDLRGEVTVALREGVAGLVELGLALKEPRKAKLRAGGRGRAAAVGTTRHLPVRRRLGTQPPPLVASSRGAQRGAGGAGLSPLSRPECSLRAPPSAEHTRAVGARSGGAPH